MADYYCCPLEAAMRSVLPNVIRKAEVGHKRQLFARLAREVGTEEIEALRARAPLQAGVLDYLIAAQKPVIVAELSEQCDATHQVIQALAKKGLIISEDAKIERDPFERETFVAAGPIELNAEQATVFTRVRAAIAFSHPSHEADGNDGTDATREAPRALLLHGVTGSGKTRFTFRRSNSSSNAARPRSCSCRKSRSRPRRSSVSRRALPPRNTKSRSFTPTSVKASVMMNGTRFARAARASSSERGPPSSLHARISVSLSSMKNTRTPTSRRKRRAITDADLAVLRASMEKCACLLGSATPSLESFHNAQIGKYELLRLTTRVDDKKMPLIRIIDLRQESAKRSGNSLRAPDHRDP
jgi:primosomal protein N' (replication factor Y)